MSGNWIGWALLIVGGYICALNFYLSFGRFALHRLRGGAKSNYRWISGFPLVGSLLVLAGWTFWLRGGEAAATDLTAWTLIVLDTGGLHWFAFSLVWARMMKRATDSDA